MNAYTYPQLWEMLDSQKGKWLWLPVNSYIWAVIPNTSVVSSKHTITDYIPNWLYPTVVGLGYQSSFLEALTPLIQPSLLLTEPVPIYMNGVILLNSSCKSYCMVENVISIYEDDFLYQYLKHGIDYSFFHTS